MEDMNSWIGKDLYIDDTQTFEPIMKRGEEVFEGQDGVHGGLATVMDIMAAKNGTGHHYVTFLGVTNQEYQLESLLEQQNILADIFGTTRASVWKYEEPKH